METRNHLNGVQPKNLKSRKTNQIIMKLKNLLLVGSLMLILSSCSVRLVDFTVISSKQVNMEIDKTQGKQVVGKKSYFLGIGFNIKDALDRALNEAGPSYDLLVDGVVRYSSYPFVSTVKVEGTAISSSKMKARMGEAGFKKWLEGKKIFDVESEERLANNE